MKAKEVRELSLDEIEQKLRECRAELDGLNIRKVTGQVENTGRIRTLRRDIARLETVKTQKRNS